MELTTTRLLFTPYSSPRRPVAVPFTTTACSSDSHSLRLPFAQTLQSETLKTLEWSSVCKQLSSFTSTSMGLGVARDADIPIGKTPAESRKLLDQTTAAVLAAEYRQWDLSGIEDVSAIVESARKGELLTIGEICTVRRMLSASRKVGEELEVAAAAGGRDSFGRYSPLLEILYDCDFCMDLERKIEYCVECNLSIILDRASEDLEIIRSERKSNMEELDSLLKEVSGHVFRAGGIDRPLITKRRSRMCVGIRASHRYLLSGGLVLSVSSSGATYFMEPKEAIELNNMEVRLSNAERDEEIAILSLLTSEIADAGIQIKHILDRVIEIDLAFARASYARWLNGVCPTLSSDHSDGSCAEADHVRLVDIESIRHPLLLESSVGHPGDVAASNSPHFANLNNSMRGLTSSDYSGTSSDFPVPVDIKIERGTKVVVISGPNTGGKTASMKTLGLASLMSKAGMYLPAKDSPRVPWFDLILADIGDHQSLEQNLSTFSGHISRICKILDVASTESLVLIDEIGSGTDPSEGVALSVSILQYLKNRIHLAVVTTHYADLTLLKEDRRFENAAMEFSLKTLQPTYRILWGSTGDSNALNIAKSIGFDGEIIERAKEWVERLRPERQQERKGFLYQSLLEERDHLKAQAEKAASLHVEVMNLYQEILHEAEDIDNRQKALMAKETHHALEERKAAEMEIQTVVKEFENNLEDARPDQLNSLVRKCESSIASILEAHQPGKLDFPDRSGDASYVPQNGEQVHVKGLGNKLATVVEETGDDDTILVQFGKVRVRVNKNDVRAVANSRRSRASGSIPQLRRKNNHEELQNQAEGKKDEGSLYGPLLQTSKNTVDLRGMRVEEAAIELDMAISSRGSYSVIFIIHGMGTGAVKERVLEILKNHPRVAKYEQESSLNYGCTVAYIS
ncbi:endonuclease MutS2 isoform X2 [Rhodamnia argentea]|uniref:Endonuclease MutS2 isoform X2 n=1 Tax=Rhodamnia argentea TaxID=178133 RepID=A0ABM3HXI0_9MYRT|nr:endonuclease MutS2 isoform X2 [Rhodamnia argentea]